MLAEKNTEQLENLLERTTKEHIPVPRLLYSRLLSGYTLRKDLEGILSTYTKMKKDTAAPPDTVVFTQVMNALKKLGGGQYIEQVFIDLLGSGIKFDALMLETAMQCCLHNPGPAAVDNAMRLIMLARPHLPSLSRVIVNTFFQICIRNGTSPEQMMRHCRDFKASNSEEEYALTFLFQYFLNTDSYKNAEHVRALMQEVGIAPSSFDETRFESLRKGSVDPQHTLPSI